MLIRLSISQDRGLCPENTHSSYTVNSVDKHILGATEDTLDTNPPSWSLKYNTRCQTGTSFCTNTRRQGQLVQGSSNGTKRLRLRSQDPWSLVGDSQPLEQMHVGWYRAETCWTMNQTPSRPREGCRHALDGLQRQLSVPPGAPGTPFLPALERQMGAATFLGLPWSPLVCWLLPQPLWQKEPLQQTFTTAFCLQGCISCTGNICVGQGAFSLL